MTRTGEKTGESFRARPRPRRRDSKVKYLSPGGKPKYLSRDDRAKGLIACFNEQMGACEAAVFSGIGEDGRGWLRIMGVRCDIFLYDGTPLAELHFAKRRNPKTITALRASSGEDVDCFEELGRDSANLDVREGASDKVAHREYVRFLKKHVYPGIRDYALDGK